MAASDEDALVDALVTLWTQEPEETEDVLNPPPPPQATGAAEVKEETNLQEEKTEGTQTQNKEVSTYVRYNFPSVVVNYDIMVGQAVVGQPTVADCVICGETLQGTQVRILTCSHLFHDSCYQKWKDLESNNRFCPTCRNDLSPPQVLEALTPKPSDETLEESKENLEEFTCNGCENCDYDCDNDVDEEGDVCRCCAYEYSISDAFSTYGHQYGVAGTYTCKFVTYDVKDVIEELGYQVTEELFGSNPCCITEIKDSNGIIVYPIEGYEIGGYDERPYQEVLPEDILLALEGLPYNWRSID